MQSDSSCQLAPDRRTSLLTKPRPLTSGSPYATSSASSTTSTAARRNRHSFHPPSSSQRTEWNFFQQVADVNHASSHESHLYADPFQNLPSTPAVPGVRPTRQHVRRQSLSESIRSSFSNVRSLGRRVSLTVKGKSKTNQDERPELENNRLSFLPDHEQSSEKPHGTESPPPTRARNMMFSLRPRRRPSMPLLKFTPPTDNELHEHCRPSYHRAATVSQRPDYPSGGAGARASAAAQNEALHLARATPLPPYRPRSDDSMDDLIRDSESGIGIGDYGLDRSESRTTHVLRIDPVDMLAPELLEHMLSFLDAETLLKLELVSSRWRNLCHSQSVWRQVFYREYAPSRSRRVLGAPPIAGLGKNNIPGQDFRKLYSVRKQIDHRWANAEAAAIYLNGHKDSVYCVQFDEDKIITGSRDHTIRVWDARTYQCIKKLGPPGHHDDEDNPRRNPIAPNGVAPIFLMEASSMEIRPPHLSMWHQASVLCLQYDGDVLVTGSSDFTCIVWSIKNDYRPLFRLTGHRAGVLDVCVDAKRIVTCSKDTTIKIWNKRTGALMQTLTGHRGPVNAVQVRGNLLASASGDGMAKLWRLDTGMCIKEFHSRERGLACIEFSEDGRTIFAGGNDHVIYEYDTTNGKVKRELSGHKELVRSLHLDSANGRIVSGSYDHSVKVWSVHNGQNEQDGGMQISFEGWTSSWMLAAKSNYRKIACASQDGRVVIMDFGYGINGVESVEA